jgi:uncharacterized DUF497 family protein
VKNRKLDKEYNMSYDLCIRLDGIDWDDEKNEKNKREHDLAFEVAQYVFFDAERLERLDQSEGNRSGEIRYQTLGMVGKVFFVVYTERGEKKQLISARAANKAERRSYNGYYLIDGKGWSRVIPGSDT